MFVDREMVANPSMSSAKNRLLKPLHIKVFERARHPDGLLGVIGPLFGIDIDLDVVANSFSDRGQPGYILFLRLAKVLTHLHLHPRDSAVNVAGLLCYQFLLVVVGPAA